MGAGAGEDGEGRVTKPLLDRFWAKVEKDRGCWTWTGGRTTAGYGMIFKGTRPVYAHRLSYEMHRGAIPDGMLVMHSCDHPWCVNPKHLLLGTDMDNKRDSMRKGRHAFGSRNGKAKLSPSTVREIRRRLALGHKQRVIAKALGVVQPLISMVHNGHVWAHVKTTPDTLARIVPAKTSGGKATL